VEPLSQPADFPFYFRSADMVDPECGAAGDRGGLPHSRAHPESDRLAVRPGNPCLHLVLGDHRHRFLPPFGVSPEQDLER